MAETFFFFNVEKRAGTIGFKSGRKSFLYYAFKKYVIFDRYQLSLRLHGKQLVPLLPFKGERPKLMKNSSIG